MAQTSSLHVSRPNLKQETTRFVIINEFDQGLCFLQNPTKSTKRRPLQIRLEITSKWLTWSSYRLTLSESQRHTPS